MSFQLPRLDGDRQRELYEGSAGQWAGMLEHVPFSQITHAWALMRERRAGLSQEAMRGA